MDHVTIPAKRSLKALPIELQERRTCLTPRRARLGIVLFVLGLGFAIWTRLHIGRNWGTPMTRKHDPELVCSGPYRLVRHPIYSGILLAGVYFVYSATVEERYLTEQFPESYPAYKRSTKMLAPFVF